MSYTDADHSQVTAGFKPSWTVFVACNRHQPWWER